MQGRVAIKCFMMLLIPCFAINSKLLANEHSCWHVFVTTQGIQQIPVSMHSPHTLPDKSHRYALEQISIHGDQRLALFRFESLNDAFASYLTGFGLNQRIVHFVYFSVAKEDMQLKWAAFHGDRTILVAHNQKELHVRQYGIEASAQIHPIDIWLPLPEYRAVRGIAVSQDGRLMAVSREPSWAESNRRSESSGNPSYPGAPLLFNLETRSIESLQPRSVKDLDFVRMEFSPDGKLLAGLDSGSEGNSENFHLSLWDTVTHKLIDVEEIPFRTRSIMFSRNGAYMFTTDNNHPALQVWSIKNGLQLERELSLVPPDDALDGSGRLHLVDIGSQGLVFAILQYPSRAFSADHAPTEPSKDGLPKKPPRMENILLTWPLDELLGNPGHEPTIIGMLPPGLLGEGALTTREDALVIGYMSEGKIAIVPL